jgi:initiation factor 1A
MVKNSRGGNKAKRQKNSGGDTSRRALVTKDNSADSSQLYGKVLKRLGGRPAFVLILCEDGIERKCVIRGKFNKRVWFNENDYVIITYNQTSSDKSGEIEHKYFPHEVAQLVSRGELDESKFKTDNAYDEDDVGIVFAKEEPKKEDDGYGDLWNQPKTDRVFVANMDDDDEDDEWNIDDI